MKAPVLGVFEKKQGITALQTPEFIGLCGHKHDVVAVVPGEAGDHPQVRMMNIVEFLDGRHRSFPGPLQGSKIPLPQFRQQLPVG